MPKNKDRLEAANSRELQIGRISMGRKHLGSSERFRSELEAHLSRLLSDEPGMFEETTGWSVRDRLAMKRRPGRNADSPERIAMAIRDAIKPARK